MRACAPRGSACCRRSTAPDRPLAVTTARGGARRRRIRSSPALRAMPPASSTTSSATTPALRGQLDAAIVAARGARAGSRARRRVCYELIAKHKIASGVEACRAGLAGVPVRARAAARVPRGARPGRAARRRSATRPPARLDVATVIGKHLAWHVVTTRGEIVIELRPDVAPWNVATIVALTQRGFYDGLAFHRVVPDFVVQGGDPTELRLRRPRVHDAGRARKRLESHRIRDGRGRNRRCRAGQRRVAVVRDALPRAAPRRSLHLHRRGA